MLPHLQDLSRGDDAVVRKDGRNFRELSLPHFSQNDQLFVRHQFRRSVSSRVLMTEGPSASSRSYCLKKLSRRATKARSRFNWLLLFRCSLRRVMLWLLIGTALSEMPRIHALFFTRIRVVPRNGIRVGGT